jgi:dTMP kinase
MFITLEGLDGCGKTTVAKALVAKFKEQGKEVVLTREPGGSPVAEQIRTILLDNDNSSMTPETEALLYAAARAQHWEETISPALNEGKIVICDRWLGSSLAYQGWARGLGIGQVTAINDFGIRGVRPDLQVFIDVPAEVRAQRKAKLGIEADRLENNDQSFFQLAEDYFNWEVDQVDYAIKVDGTLTVDEIVDIILARM